MRILLVVSQDEEIGGVASVVGNLANFLISRGHQIFFLHPSDTTFLKRKTTKQGFPGFALRMQLPFGERHPAISLLAFSVFFPIGMYQIARLIRKHRIDIVNIHYPADCFFYLALCKRILGVGLITSIHGADVFPDGTPPNKYSLAVRVLFSSSDLIVAPSRGFQQNFLTVFPKLNGKTTFIHNGINLTELNGLCAESTSKRQTPYILCVSACKEQKAIDVLLHAFKQVQLIDPSIRLVVVGGGPLREPLETLARSLGIQDRIEFVGQRIRSEVATLMRGCELFVLPSRFETFGIVILEAMACKKPVVATSVGGIPEIIEHQKNGILVEPDNPDALAAALVTVLKDPTLQRVIAKNGFDTVQKQFGSANSGTAYEKVFTDLLNSAEHRAA
jgi:glycosyltransferase involved in cell wall biosynthesis